MSKKREYIRPHVSYQNLIMNCLDSIHQQQDLDNMVAKILLLHAYLKPQWNEDTNYQDTVKPLFGIIDNAQTFGKMFSACRQLLEAEMDLIDRKRLISIKKVKTVIPAKSYPTEEEG